MNYRSYAELWLAALMLTGANGMPFEHSMHVRDGGTKRTITNGASP
jgi:hypothetical protein